MQQLQVREVMRPPKGDNITLAQAKRVFRQIRREQADHRKREQRARGGSPEVPRGEG